MYVYVCVQTSIEMLVYFQAWRENNAHHIYMHKYIIYTHTDPYIRNIYLYIHIIYVCKYVDHASLIFSKALT